MDLSLSAALPAPWGLLTAHPSSSRSRHSLLSSLWVICSIDRVSPAFVMHSSVPGHFGCSHALVLTRETVARMVFWKYLPLRRGITGCVGSRVFCFEGTSLLFSVVALSSLRCHQECGRVPFSTCPVYYWLCYEPLMPGVGQSLHRTVFICISLLTSSDFFKTIRTV